MKIRAVHYYDGDEINKAGDDSIKFALGLALIDKLQETGMIQYSREITNEGVNVIAEINITKDD